DRVERGIAKLAELEITEPEATGTLVISTAPREVAPERLFESGPRYTRSVQATCAGPEPALVVIHENGIVAPNWAEQGEVERARRRSRWPRGRGPRSTDWRPTGCPG